MSVKLTQLQCKEVICIKDGMRLGYISDVLVEVPEGSINAIVVPGPCRFFGMVGRGDDYVPKILKHVKHRADGDKAYTESDERALSVTAPPRLAPKARKSSDDESDEGAEHRTFIAHQKPIGHTRKADKADTSAKREEKEHKPVLF